MIFLKRKKGQSLIELILAIALGVVFIGVAAVVVAPLLKINTETNEAKVGGAWARELMENTRLWVETGWGNLDSVSRGNSVSYYLSTSTETFSLYEGVESIVVGTTTYNRYFYIEGVCRDPSNDVISGLAPCFGFPEEDPSVIQVTVGYSWSPEYATKTFSAILSRFRNSITTQTDWSLGPGVGGSVSSTSGFSTSSNLITTSSPGFLMIQGFVQ